MPRSNCPLCNRKTGGLRWGVNYYEIEKYFTDAGQSAPHIRAVAHAMEDNARRLAPYRTGRLRNLHYNWIGNPKGLGRSFYVGTKAAYAKFLRGTKGNGSGYIYPKRGDELELRPIPYSWFKPGSPGRFRERVKGQKKHQRADWLDIAGQFTLYQFNLGPRPAFLRAPTR